jgi:hypothetical protein
MKKILKVGLGGDLQACLAAAAQREQVAEAELVRRALWLCFGAPGCAVRPGPGRDYRRVHPRQGRDAE